MPAFPAARIGDTVSHDLLVPAGVIGTPLSGPCPEGWVVIEGLPAAHVNCTVLCLGTMQSGVVPSPLHTAPVPVVAPAASGADGSTGSSDGSNVEPDSDEPSSDVSTEFTLELLGGWTGAASLPIGKLSGLPIPEPGIRVDHLVVRITDSHGNAAIYDYDGGGDTIGWGESISGGTFASGKPVRFQTRSPYTVEEFAGKARLNSTQAGGSTSYAFKFGPPKEWDLVWNEDFFRDGFGKMGIAPFAQLRQYEVEIDEFEIQDAVPSVVPPRTLFSIDDSEGLMQLIKVIPKPPPTPAVPVLLPVPSTNPIILGSQSVFVHGMPAARWAPSGDVTACLAMLGDLILLPTRTVWVG